MNCRVSVVTLLVGFVALGCSKDSEERAGGLENPSAATGGAGMTGGNEGEGGDGGAQSGEPTTGENSDVVDPCETVPVIDSLGALQTLADAECESLNGDLVIGENFRGNALTSLEGLETVVQIRGDLVITNLDVTSLQGLEGLREVEGDIRITYNDDLRELDALSDVARVGGDLALSYNLRLTSLSGLAAWTSGSVLGGVSINNHELLAQCEVDGLLESLAASCLEPADRECETLNNGSGGC